MQHDAKSGAWDMKSIEPAPNRLNTLDQLRQIRMGPNERRLAKAYLRQAELLADMFMWVDAELQRRLGFAGHGIGALARRSKVRALTPEPN
jgi:hypothetical protein